MAREQSSASTLAPLRLRRNRDERYCAAADRTGTRELTVELRHLRYVIAAAESASFRATARVLSIEQSAVSMPAQWLVSINLALAERGKGYGRVALSAAIETLRGAVGSSRIVAEIKSEHEPSMRLFQALGFVTRSEQDGFQSFVLE